MLTPFVMPINAKANKTYEGENIIMKKKLFTAIITPVAALTLTSCIPVPANEINPIFTDGSEQVITTVQSTEAGSLYTFTDGTGYYAENDTDIPGISTYNSFYPLTGIVTEVEYDIEPNMDLITITSANGNIFSWYADSTDCWELNDLASCIMDSKGTKYVYDDKVVLAHYAGGLDQLAEFTAK